MKVFKFKVAGMCESKIIHVLAHDEKEACKMASKLLGREIDSRHISDIYKKPQIISIEIED